MVITVTLKQEIYLVKLTLEDYLKLGPHRRGRVADKLCMCVAPAGRYEEIIEALEYYALYFEAERLLVRAAGGREILLSENEVYRGLGIQKGELDRIEVELEE